MAGTPPADLAGTSTASESGTKRLISLMEATSGIEPE
jgi:hypothetical protein